METLEAINKRKSIKNGDKGKAINELDSILSKIEKCKG